jgi:hypothetical protein
MASARSAEHASAFAALGDATRLAIVTRLSKGAAQSITQLTGLRRWRGSRRTSSARIAAEQ